MGLSDANSRRLRLEEISTSPDADILKRQLAEANRRPGRLIELPWKPANSKTSFVLTVVRNDRQCDKPVWMGDPAQGRPVWSLYQSQDYDSKLVWTTVDADLEVICDIMKMFAADAQLKVQSKNETCPDGGKEKPAKFFDNLTPKEFDLLKKKPNVLLGYLLVEAGIIPEMVLDSALKIQEMVRNESLSSNNAVDALRKVVARLSSQSNVSSMSKTD